MSKLIDQVGGIRQVQQALRDAVISAKERQGLSTEELDHACGFSQGNLNLPSSGAIEENISLLTSEFFSLASFALDLHADVVLDPFIKKIPEDVRAGIIRELELNPCVAATTGNDPSSNDPSSISAEDQFPVYAVFRLFDELDESVRQARTLPPT